MSKTSKPAPMVLPQFTPGAHPAVQWATFWSDVRVPSPVERDIPAGPLADHIRAEACPDGRHLFDAIEASANETYDEDAETSSQRFRLVLTCVRCGLVVPIEGVQDTTRSRTTSVGPVPLQAGGLRAQQISQRGSWLGRDTDTYLVHDASDAVVGGIDWACGKRGRAYYVGRLTAWPTGRHVEAPSAAGCLRKLAHAHTATTPAATPATPDTYVVHDDIR
jgi:hypothetical protein